MAFSKNRPRLTLDDVRKSGMTRELLIALHETPGIGDLTICGVVLYGIHHPNGALRHAESLLAGDWREMGLSSTQATALVDSLRPDTQRRRARHYREAGIGIMTYLDERYSPILRESYDPPWVLYYRGNWELVHRPAIAIVGTRQATAYGRKMAEELGMGCARRMTVVSGMARGIDAAAHTGALRGAQGTIAVLASPVEVCYPPEHRRMYDEIVRTGLVLSETVPGTPLHPGMFPMRNRIIAGLSMGVIVVEASQRSGALITADLALSYDRDIFIVPGPVSSPRSKGALTYFRRGATPVLDESDVFTYYKYRLPPEPAHIAVDPDNAKKRVDEDAEWTQEERLVYELLLDGPRSIDALADLSGMTFGLLQSVLLSLMIKRRVIQQPGSVYKVL